MRWLKSITVTVGAILRATKNTDEPQMVADALRLFNARLTKADLLKWEELMAKNGFPKATKAELSNAEALVEI